MHCPPVELAGGRSQRLSIRRTAASDLPPVQVAKESECLKKEKGAKELEGKLAVRCDPHLFRHNVILAPSQGEGGQKELECEKEVKELKEMLERLKRLEESEVPRDPTPSNRALF